MRRALLALIALLMIAAGAYFFWDRGPQDTAQEADTSTPQAPSLTVSERNEETEAYVIRVRYPQFGIPAADAAVRAKVDAAVAAFKSYPADLPSADSVPKNELDISYNSVYTGDDYISVALVIAEYTGGAHPNSVIVGVNVDRASGAPVTLEEALSLIGMRLSDVAAEAGARLSASLGDAFFEEGAAASAENYSMFLIGEHDVTFVFNTYQVAPYAAGPQSLSFPRI